MNILMIMDGYGIGGAELQFIELANQLAKRNKVTMMCLHGSNAVADGRLSSAIPVERFPYSSGRKAMPQLLAAMWKALRLPAEVIVTTSYIGDTLGRVAKLGNSGRLVSLQTVSAPKKYPGIDRRILKSFDALVAGCEDIKEYLLDHQQDPKRIHIVNNWVDFSARQTTETVAQTRNRFGLPQDARVIGCIGRMHHQKGQEYLIRAFRLIADKFPDTVLTLVGDGPRMQEIKAEADGHPRIIFTGTITGADYTNLLAAFDLYVQPSRYEGLPRTLLDAMYMGRPLIATAVNGNKDAIRDGVNGLMVPPEDHEQLAESLVRVLSDQVLSKRLASQAASDARSDFSMAIQTARIEAILLAQ